MFFMKRTLLLLIAGVLAFTACKKSSNSRNDENEEVYELPYNKEGVTANKAFLESEGRDFIKKIEDINTNTAIKALESFGNLNAPELDITVSALTKIGTSTQKIAGINHALAKIAAAGAAKESYKLSKAFGIYTYNPSKKDWDKTTSNDKIEFHFPAIKGGKTNNAVLTINYKNSGKSIIYNTTETSYIYNVKTNQYDWVEKDVEKTYELPSTLTASLNIGGTTAMNINSNYTYHSDNLPNLANVNIEFGAYKANAEVNNDKKDVNIKFGFTKGNETLIAVTGNSNFNVLSYDKLINQKEEDLLDLLNSANTSLKIGNVMLSGHLNFKIVYNELKPIDDKRPTAPNWDSYFENIKYPNYSDYYNNYAAYQKALEEYNIKSDIARKAYNIAYEKYRVGNEKVEKEYYTVLANSLNKNSAMVVANTKTNTKIASVFFQLDEDSYNYTNENTSITHYYYDLEPLLEFGDGSKIDFETFGDTGFQNLIDDIESLLNKFDS